MPGTDHAAWLRDCGIPVLMTDRVPGLPTAVRFPIERLIEKFSIDYFTSTVAYMVAFTLDYIDQQVEVRLRAARDELEAVAGDHENPVRGAMQEILRQRLWLQENAATADLAKLEAVRQSLDAARASLELQLQRVSQARAGR